MTTTIIDTKDIESNSTSPPTTTTTNKPVPSSKKKWIILSVIAMLFVFGIFGFKYFSTKVTNSPQNKKPSVTSAANSDLLEEAEEENVTLEEAIKMVIKI